MYAYYIYDLIRALNSDIIAVKNEQSELIIAYGSKGVQKGTVPIKINFFSGRVCPPKKFRDLVY